jgi:hypothetical protein
LTSSSKEAGFDGYNGKLSGIVTWMMQGDTLQNPFLSSSAALPLALSLAIYFGKLSNWRKDPAYIPSL